MASYKLTSRNGAHYIYLPDLEDSGIKHFFTTRKSNGYDPTPFGSKEVFVMVKQVHRDNILVIDKPVDDIITFAMDAIQRPFDAIITNQSHIGIGVVTADCLPVLLYDPVQSVIAAVHAGWRGTIKGILPKVVGQMVYMFKCRVEDIVAGTGPAIGACCYVVGETVIRPLRSINPEWERYLTPLEDGKARLDLTALNIRQIEGVGILEKNIFGVDLCTSCNEGLFFSYRRDGISAGRMISGIII